MKSLKIILLLVCALCFGALTRYRQPLLLIPMGASWCLFLAISGFFSIGNRISKMSTTREEHRDRLATAVSVATKSVKNTGDIISINKSGDPEDAGVYGGVFVDKLMKKAEEGVQVEIICTIPEDVKSAEELKKAFRKIFADSLLLELIQLPNVKLYKSSVRWQPHFTVIDNGRDVVVERFHKIGEDPSGHRLIRNSLFLGRKYNYTFSSLKSNAEEISFSD